MKLIKVILVVAIAVSAVVMLGGCFGAGSGAQDDALHSVVPDVMGKTQADATAALTEAGYVVGEVSAGSGAEPGTVASQDPVAGTSVPRETPVNLVISQ